MWSEFRRQFRTVRQEQIGPVEQLLGFMVADPTVLDIRFAAYMLATVQHETADTYAPVRESFRQTEDWRRRNLRYFPFYGRGYVQLTWEANYAKAGRLLGVDLVEDPDAALIPAHSYQIMTWGMREGWFTGKKLADYLTPDRTDYVNARRIINGTDRAPLVAGYAQQWERILGAACFAD